LVNLPAESATGSGMKSSSSDGTRSCRAGSRLGRAPRVARVGCCGRRSARGRGHPRRPDLGSASMRVVACWPLAAAPRGSGWECRALLRREAWDAGCRWELGRRATAAVEDAGRLRTQGHRRRPRRCGREREIGRRKRRAQQQRGTVWVRMASTETAACRRGRGG
jgi:hypothetical protein